MRKLLMTTALIALLAIPAIGQFPGFGRGGLTGDALLTNKTVQDELKLTDEQKKSLAEIATKQAEANKEARPLFTEDRDKAMEILKKSGDEAAKSLKKVREGLTAKQAERLAQIEIQMATSGKQKNPDAFKIKAVADALKYTDKQNELIKETLEGVVKDTKELQDDAKDKKGKERFAVRGKINEVRSAAYDKILEELTDDQKAALEKAKGAKFELKFEFPKDFGKDFGKAKGKKDVKKKEEKKDE